MVSRIAIILSIAIRLEMVLLLAHLASPSGHHTSLKIKKLGLLAGLHKNHYADYNQGNDFVRFYLYDNPRNFTQNTELKMNFDSVADSNFRIGKPVKIIIHGFLGSFTTMSTQEIKDAYLQYTKKYYNIICVDWSDLASPKLLAANLLLYKVVVSNVPIVGKKVGEFLTFLTDNNFVHAANIHMIGFSLGAHVVSHAASTFTKKTNFVVARITGLDPARLSQLAMLLHIEILEMSTKILDKSDAKFVDVIHTNTALLAYQMIWGGVSQPNCSVVLDVKGLPQLLGGLTEPLSGYCSHFKAPAYFASSINYHKVIIACKCESWDDFQLQCGKSCHEDMVFGERCSKMARGRYYVKI